MCVAVLLLDALAKFRPCQKQVNFIFRADRPANHSSGSGSGSNIGSSSNNTCHLPLASCQLPVASREVASCQLPLDVQKPQTQISTVAATQRNVAAAAVAARASNKNNPAIISFATMPSPWATHSHTCTLAHICIWLAALDSRFWFLLLLIFIVIILELTSLPASQPCTSPRHVSSPASQLISLSICHRHCHRHRLVRHKVRIANVLRSVWIRSWQATRRYASLAHLSAVSVRYQLVVAFN